MRGKLVFLCLAAFLSGCSDNIQPLQQTRSPNGDVEANYVKVLYGGAAGGVTYCVNLHYGTKQDDCAIAAIHVRKGNLSWLGRTLVYTHCDGTVTNNESGFKRADGVLPFALLITEKCS